MKNTAKIHKDTPKNKNYFLALNLKIFTPLTNIVYGDPYIRIQIMGIKKHEKPGCDILTKSKGWF